MHATTEPELDRATALPLTEPLGSSYDEAGEFRAQTVLAMFLTGAALGAGAALLLAPESGKKTRRRISRRVRRITGREKSAWGRLRHTLAQAAADRRSRSRREDQRSEDMRASSERARAL